MFIMNEEVYELEESLPWKNRSGLSYWGLESILMWLLARWNKL